MKKQKSYKKGGIIPPPPEKPPLRTIRGTDNEMAERAIKRREKEIQIVNIVGGILGIGTLIYAGFTYGFEMSIILVLIVISNNLCNVK